MSNTAELRNRVEAKKHDLLARYNELKADSRAEVTEQRSKLKNQLDELEDYIKDGWENVTETVSAKLNRWLNN